MTIIWSWSDLRWLPQQSDLSNTKNDPTLFIDVELNVGTVADSVSQHMLQALMQIIARYFQGSTNMFKTPASNAASDMHSFMERKGKYESMRCCKLL